MTKKAAELLRLASDLAAAQAQAAAMRNTRNTLAKGSNMNRDEIEELRELAKKATPGPWECRRDLGWIVQNFPLIPHGRITPEPTAVTDVCTDGEENDVRFIAAANPDTILRLLAALDAARADGFRSGIEAVAKIAHECPYATLRELIGMARNLTPPSDPGAGK